MLQSFVQLLPGIFLFRTANIPTVNRLLTSFTVSVLPLITRRGNAKNAGITAGALA
jgi:hypothetical protein